MTTMPADPTPAEGVVEMRRAILDWLRDDAPVAAKMTIMPGHVDALMNKLWPVHIAAARPSAPTQSAAQTGEVECEVCKRGEVRHFSMDDGFWVEITTSAGGANEHGLNGWIETLEHYPDGLTKRREYVATDSPALSTIPARPAAPTQSAARTGEVETEGIVKLLRDQAAYERLHYPPVNPLWIKAAKALQQAMQALSRLEIANEALCQKRSAKTYDSMLLRDRSGDELTELDEARRQARLTIAALSQREPGQ